MLNVNVKTNDELITASKITTRSHLFFEQASNDLAAYAEHAGRRTVDETDVELLMKRYNCVLI